MKCELYLFPTKATPLHHHHHIYSICCLRMVYALPLAFWIALGPMQCSSYALRCIQPELKSIAPCLLSFGDEIPF